MKVAQYGAVLLTAWQQAVEGTLRVPCGKGEAGRKKAVHLRYRMYGLRSAMQRENHPLYPTTLRAKLSLLVEDGEHIVRGQLVDSDLEKVLADSGVRVPAAPEIEDL